MKFHRQDLIDRIRAAIAAHRKNVEDRNASSALDHQKRLAQYVDDTREDWKRFADTIRLRLRTGKPITIDDIPVQLRDGRSSYVRVWSSKPPAPLTADTSALEQLLVLLQATTDSEVTLSALERMGFRTAKLFTH